VRPPSAGDPLGPEEPSPDKGGGGGGGGVRRRREEVEEGGGRREEHERKVPPPRSEGVTENQSVVGVSLPLDMP